MAVTTLKNDGIHDALGTQWMLHVLGTDCNNFISLILIYSPLWQTTYERVSMCDVWSVPPVLF